MLPITFVIPVGSNEVYKTCFLASPLFKKYPGWQIIAQEGFRSASHAYNDAIEKAENDIVVFAHQDVVFPINWAERFLQEFYKIEGSERNVGVVGCIGITKEGNKAGHIYRHDREFFPSHPLPAQVETLDELLVCFRKSSSLRFDVNLPSFFFYGVDICLQSDAMGYKNFAVNAPCFHQAKNRAGLPKEFYESWDFIVNKWRDRLPVQSLSGPITGNRQLFIQKYKSHILNIIGQSENPWWHKLPKAKVEAILYDDE
ncbi:MAG: glycosyltransferase family A protein [Syntrophales bacterium]|jgi:hypothetical protein